MSLPNNSRNYEQGNLARVRGLRGAMSDSEKLLWTRLRADKLGFRFRRQHPVSPYVMDFFCRKAMLCIEVDGEQHEFDRDRSRDAYLDQLGVVTLRIPSKSLWDGKRIVEIVRDILEICKARSGRDPFSEEPGTSP